MNMKKLIIILIILLVLAVLTAACVGESQEPVEESESVEEIAEEIDEEIVEETEVVEEEEVVIEEETTEDENTAPELVGTTWQWIRFDDMGEINNLDIEDPASYTLLLNSDGIYHLKADCNMVSGNYSMESSGLSFKPGLTTLAECGEESHYYKYLLYIENVATYVMEGNTLYLNLWADGGNMVFIPVE